MRNLMLFALWLAASGAAVATAWAGVSVVDSQVAPPSVIGLDEGESEFAIEAAGDNPGSPATQSATSANSATLSSDSPDSISGASSTTASTASATPATQGQATVSPNTAPPNSSAATNPPSTSGATQTSSTQQTTSQATTSTTQATTSTTQATTSTTQATTSTTQAATTKTFNLVGGSTAVSFSSSGVQVLWATPNPGFDVEIENEGSGMKVEFESDDHRSRVDVWWSGGPRHEIRERADDD